MAFSLKVTGLRGVQRRLAGLVKRYPDATAAALYQEGFSLDAASVARTPVKTGRLRASHYVGPPQDTLRGPVVEVGNGTDYAAAVHERTEVKHAIGSAKFLETAAKERAVGYRERLERRIEENVKRGIGARAIPPMAPTEPKD